MSFGCLYLFTAGLEHVTLSSTLQLLPCLVERMLTVLYNMQFSTGAWRGGSVSEVCVCVNIVDNLRLIRSI